MSEVFTKDDTNVQAFQSLIAALQQQYVNNYVNANLADQIVGDLPTTLAAQVAAGLGPIAAQANSALSAAQALVNTLPQLRSTTTSNPPNPTTDELNANAEIFGTRLTPDLKGIQTLHWNRSTGTYDPYGDPTATKADTDAAKAVGQAAGQVAGAAQLTLTGTVNGASYGCQDGADAATILATIAAAPDGSSIQIPKGSYVHNGGRLLISGRNRLKIYLNGSTVKATANLSDPSAGQNGGFYFFNCTEIDVYDATYDGALDTRTPYGGDASGTNLKSGWSILTGCVGVRLHNVRGNRCMMDGIYVGHGDSTVSGMPTVAQANMPTNIVLNHCGGDGNYRQGLSVVGVNGLTGSGNKFSNTGQTGGKYTSPAAGIDFEAFLPGNYLNLGIDLTDTEVNGCRGLAVSVESGTQGLRMRGLRGYGNAGGLSFAATSSNNEVSGLNLVSSGTNPVEPINVVVRGTNNHVRGGTLTCNDGSRAGYVGSDGFLCGLHDLTATAPAGSAHTATFISDGGETVFEGLTVTDGRALSGYGVIDARGSGGRVTDCRVVGYNSDSTSVPFKVAASVARASGLTSSGYSQPSSLLARGGALTVTPSLVLSRTAGRAVTLTLVSRDLVTSSADRNTHRVIYDVVTTGSGTEGYVALYLSGQGTAGAVILAATTVDNNTGIPVPTALATDLTTMSLATPPSTAVSLRVVLTVEVFRV